MQHQIGCVRHLKIHQYWGGRPTISRKQEAKHIGTHGTDNVGKENVKYLPSLPPSADDIARKGQGKLYHFHQQIPKPAMPKQAT